MKSWIYTSSTGWQEDPHQVSPLEMGYQAGFTLFETLKGAGNTVPFLAEHYLRLSEGARALGLSFTLSTDELQKILEAGLQKSGFVQSYIRIILAAGDRPELAKLYILLAPLTPYPEDYYKDGIMLTTSSGTTKGVEAIPPCLKTGNYLPSVMGKTEAIRQEVPDVLFLNEKGEIAETTVANLFWVKRNKLFTPPLTGGILPGITRQKVLEIAGQMGSVTKEQPGTRFDLYAADEVFLTSGLMDLLPVVLIDDRPIGNGRPGPVTRQLLAGYRKRMENVVK